MRQNASNKIVIIGHVDHGKSTLIGRLLLDTNSLSRERIIELKNISKELGRDIEPAFITDQLREEREQNKTIDTTQIFFKTKNKFYCIIDVPGHVEFLKNMISGASFASSGILIVDINSGIMEQTRRHAYIVDMLGIKNIIVVLNKMDLIGYDRDRFEKIRQELLDFFKELNLKPLFIIPISARDGVNISKRSKNMLWYKGPFLLEALDKIRPETGEDTDKPFRFPVQDIYRLDGKDVLVGKVASGNVKRGQNSVVFPENINVSIKDIKVFGKIKKIAYAGENIGLVLSECLKIKRGDILSGEKGRPLLTDFFRGDVFWMSDKPLKKGVGIILRCATQEVKCLVEKISRRINSSTLAVLEEEALELRSNEAAVVTLKSEKPVVLERFDFIKELGRFVIEDHHVLQGVGIITGLK